MSGVSAILAIIFYGWVIYSIFVHVRKHSWGHKKKTYEYNEEGNVSSVLSLTKNGKGEKDSFRLDGSLERRELYKEHKKVEGEYALFYPSGRKKYQSFETS